MLQRFYGGSPGDWLNLSARWVQAFLEVKPAIEAVEALDHVRIVGVGGGKYKKRFSDKYLRFWRRSASLLDMPRAKKRMGRDEMRRLVVASGIGIQEVPKGG